ASGLTRGVGEVVDRAGDQGPTADEYLPVVAIRRRNGVCVGAMRSQSVAQGIESIARPHCMGPPGVDLLQGDDVGCELLHKRHYAGQVEARVAAQGAMDVPGHEAQSIHAGSLVLAPPRRPTSFCASNAIPSQAAAPTG